MRKILIIMGILSFTACDKSPEKPNPIQGLACTVGKTVGIGLSAAIAEKAKCKNVAAINDDIYLTLTKIKVCEPAGAKAFSIGSSVCELAGRTLFDSVTAEKFQKWECEGGEAKEKIMGELSEICAKIKF